MMAVHWNVVLLSLLIAIAAATTALADPRRQTMLLGVDTAGSAWLSASESPLADNPAVARALQELGANFVIYHLRPVTSHGSRNPELTAGRIAAIDESMRHLGLRYMLNNEMPNFIESVEITPGQNEFAHADGTHRWDLRMEWLGPILPPGKGGERALIGITYDECEHMQLTCNQFVIRPKPNEFDAPFLVDTTGKDLETAYNRLVDKCKTLRRTHYQDRLTLSTEQVWPDMFHIFARAGWTITPKILKENLSSVVMAISLGAALEYKDSGVGWWVSPDLWCLDRYPGHSPQALRSALSMGYGLGADALYVENLDYSGKEPRHPLASPKGSVISWSEDGSYELTAYGDVVRDFYKTYVPEHPRDSTWRDYRPRVAIIRLPDGAWGQRGCFFRDRLLGNADHPMDDVSAEWLQVWPILTHGVARSGALSLNNGRVYGQYPWPFFVPIDSVAVFDHLVNGSVLDSVECFVVCGHALSDRTFGDVAKRVSDGATCVISRRLYDSHSGGTKLPGKWVIVDSFTDPAVAAALGPYLGAPDVARFRFKDFVVEFRVGQNKDVVEQRILDKR
jgi:hypothetical protein